MRCELIWIYIRYIVKSKSLYKEYRRIWRAVRQANLRPCSKLKEHLFNCVLNEKLFWCNLRIEELDRGIKKSFFPYPKRYEKLYDRLIKTIGEDDKD